MFDDTVIAARQVTGGQILAKKKPTQINRLRMFRDRVVHALRMRMRQITRYILIAIAILIAIPVLLIFLYASPSFNPVSTLMLGRWATLQPVDRQWVSYDQISPVLVRSVMMSEDAKFCAHSGVDWQALNQVIDSAIDGERTRGASTLSMQVAKNLFLWPGRSYFRKGLELPLALLADGIWTKTRMIEIYLNIAEWDEGTFGIQAASRHYFNRSANKLSARQSALLAVTLPNPKRRNPAKASKGLKKLARRIELRARQSGAYIKCVD